MVWAGPIGDWKRITNRNAGVEPAWGEAKSLHWTSDGYDVQGWLIYPRAFDAAKRYPLVVSVHGGPGAAVTGLLSGDEPRTLMASTRYV